MDHGTPPQHFPARSVQIMIRDSRNVVIDWHAIDKRTADQFEVFRSRRGGRLVDNSQPIAAGDLAVYHRPRTKTRTDDLPAEVISITHGGRRCRIWYRDTTGALRIASVKAENVERTGGGLLSPAEP